MSNRINFKKNSFLVYGLGSTGKSVVNFFNKLKITQFYVWDDNPSLIKKYKSNNKKNLKYILKKVDYIVLSPGISLRNSKNKDSLNKYRKKIITDLDLLFLSYPNFKSIIVTGSNGKSTTCKIITHLLKKNNFKVQLGGNIGIPALSLKVRKNIYYVIEASSFQLAYSKFIRPNYAILLNITNDHLDWHGSMKNYVNSKFKIFKLQQKKDFALINKIFVERFKKQKYLSKSITVNSNDYEKIKSNINNNYLTSKINDENMSFVYELSKLLKIKKYSFIKSMKSFQGLPHRFEIFFKRKNVTFINDSKATTLQASKFALMNGKNIYWILGGLPKKKDKIDLTLLRNNICRSYIIGKNTKFFKRVLKNEIKYIISKSLKKALITALKDITKKTIESKSIVLFSPGAASFDQYKNFESRGNEFKKITLVYAKKYI